VSRLVEDPDGRRSLLMGAKRVAVVGLSADEARPSHGVAAYLQATGYEIVPVNPRYAGGEILGQKVFASLAEIDRPVDIVDVFRKPAEAPALAEEAAAIGAKTLWLQLGVENDEAGEIAREHGLAFVQNRCVKIEHARFFGGLNLVGMNTGVITARRRLQ